MQVEKQWRLRLLGRFELESCLDAEQPPLPQLARGNKARVLLAYLALRPQDHSRESLAVLLWPDGDPNCIRHRLRTELHGLKALLGEETLWVNRNFARLNRGVVALDVAEFEAAANAALVEDSARAAACGMRAADLYAASGAMLLPGFYDEWVLEERERLDELYLQTLRRLVKMLERRSDFARALRYAVLLRDAAPENLRYDEAVTRLQNALVDS